MGEIPGNSNQQDKTNSNNSSNFKAGGGPNSQGQPTSHHESDPLVDKAIDDIIVSESNEVLAAEDYMYLESEEARAKKKNQSKFKKLIKNKWLYIGIIAIIIAIFAVPFSRYFILSKFVKKTYDLSVIDSVTGSPVSGAVVSYNKQTLTTDASGKAEFKLALGKYQYSISKQYYATTSGKLFVGLSQPKDNTIHLLATGRRVPITVINKLTGRPLAEVKIGILNTTAVTNSLGKTQIVLPTKQLSYEAKLIDNSFNTLTVPIKVTTSSKVNTIGMVPIGSVYYLNNSSGTINVIKANLDGSDPTVELAGTGHESSSNTVLVPSPDWKYLVLEAQRTGNQPGLFVINTATNKLTEFDSTGGSYKLIGWSGDQFVYDETATSSDSSAVSREQLKSYNATANQLSTIDQNQVDGSAPSYAYQSFSNFEMLPNLIAYTTTWNAVGGYSFTNENDSIRGVEPNGQNKKDYTLLPATTTGAMSVVRSEPESLYISVINSSTNQTSYYQFTNGASTGINISATTFSQSYPTFFISPSGELSLWSVKQNNQYLTYRANQQGKSSKRIVLPGSYQVYSWYDNVYMLLTKGNQLYIAPATGSNSPVLIGSYLNPSAS